MKNQHEWEAQEPETARSHVFWHMARPRVAPAARESTFARLRSGVPGRTWAMRRPPERCRKEQEWAPSGRMFSLMI